MRGSGGRGSQLKAIVAGAETVIADSEWAHLQAFNAAFAEEGLEWSWSVATYRELIGLRGTKERIEQFWRRTEAGRTDIAGIGVRDTIDSLQQRKDAYFEGMVKCGEVRLREGVSDLLEEARGCGIGVTVMTAESLVALGALLHRALGPDWRFGVQIMQESPSRRGNDGSGHARALVQLGLAGRECVSLEDQLTGVRSAVSAGMAVVVVARSGEVGLDNFDGLACTVSTWEKVSLSSLQALVDSGPIDEQILRVDQDVRVSTVEAT